MFFKAVICLHNTSLPCLFPVFALYFETKCTFDQCFFSLRYIIRTKRGIRNHLLLSDIFSVYLRLFSVYCSNILISHTYGKHSTFPEKSLEVLEHVCLPFNPLSLPLLNPCIKPRVGLKQRIKVIHLSLYISSARLLSGFLCSIGLTFTLTTPLVKSHCFSFPVNLPVGNCILREQQR